MGFPCLKAQNKRSECNSYHCISLLRITKQLLLFYLSKVAGVLLFKEAMFGLVHGSILAEVILQVWDCLANSSVGREFILPVLFVTLCRYLYCHLIMLHGFLGKHLSGYTLIRWNSRLCNIYLW